MCVGVGPTLHLPLKQGSLSLLWWWAWRSTLEIGGLLVNLRFLKYLLSFYYSLVHILDNAISQSTSQH